MPGPRHAALAFIYVTVLLDMLAFGLAIPVLAFLYRDLSGGDVGHAAAVSGWFGLAFAAMQLVFAPVLGSLSDRYGRRPVLSLLNSLYGAFVLPESLPPERRAAFAWKRANPLGALGMLRASPLLLGLAGVALLNNLGHDVNPHVFGFYTMDRYGFDEALVGRTRWRWASAA